jgi:hypothetical protein
LSALERKKEIKLTRRSASSFESTTTPNQLIGEVNAEIAAETGYSVAHVKNVLSLSKLIPDLRDLLKENKFSQEVALQLAQLSESDQKWVINRLSASRLKEIKTDEIKQLKTDLHNVEDTNAKLKKLIESRDKETDKLVKDQVAAEIAKARDEVAEAKRKASEYVTQIREQYEIRTKELDKKFKDDQQQPITRFLFKSITLLNLDPVECADNYWMVSIDLAEEVSNKAEALSPWLIKFAKAMRARVREARGTTLKEVR